jgi:lipopolysaccharide biosynthesis glycosyltransferase
MKNATILGTDLNHLKYIKYNINNIRQNIKNTDIVIITNEKDFSLVNEELKEKNVFIYSIENKSSPYFLKYHIFDEYFKKWDNLLYLDCDTMILEDASKLFDLLDDENEMFVDFEEHKIFDFFNLSNEEIEQNQNEFKSLLDEKNINKIGFNCGILLYKSSVISKENIDKLKSYHLKYLNINKHGKEQNILWNHKPGSDQPIVNLVFLEKCKKVPNNFFSYWKRYNADSVILHFCRWNAPWFNEEFNEKINKRYVDYFNENIS